MLVALIAQRGVPAWGECVYVWSPFLLWCWHWWKPHRWPGSRGLGLQVILWIRVRNQCVHAHLCVKKNDRLTHNLCCHIRKSCIASYKNYLHPAHPWVAYIRGLFAVNQAVIETTVCVRLSLWAIRQYQSSNHTASAHWFDLIQGGKEGAAVCWGNMSCQLQQPVSKLAATAAPSRGTGTGKDGPAVNL